MKTIVAILSLAAIFGGCATHKKPETSIRSYGVNDGRSEQALQRVQEYRTKESQIEDKVLVLGQVTTPGFYKIDGPTLKKAVLAAGGLSRLGSPSHFYILRSGHLTEYYAPHGKGIPVAFEIKRGDAVFMEYQCTSYGASALLESTVKE